MLRTISLGSCVSVQGLQVAQMSDGKVMVRVDAQTFIGTPVPSTRATDVAHAR